MANLKTRLMQLENDMVPGSSKWPLVVSTENMTPELKEEVVKAEAVGRAILRVNFIDAKI
jgi:hypothetical protein